MKQTYFLKLMKHLKIILDYNKNIPDYKQKAKQHLRQDMSVQEGTDMLIILSIIKRANNGCFIFDTDRD